MDILRSLLLLAVALGSSAMIAATPPADFECPVTPPGNSRPDREVDPFPKGASLHYEDGLWVTFPDDGIIELTPEDEIAFGPLAGWRSTTTTWLREEGVEGFIEVTGKRLDEKSDLSPQTPLSPQRQYVTVGQVQTGLAFPSEGCWELTAIAGDASATWVLEVQFIDPGSAFVCPVTYPNTSELMGLPTFPGDGMVYNEDDLWVAIPADGVLEFSPELHGYGQKPGFEDWLAFKLHIHRGSDAKGNVAITGQRLDASYEHRPTNLLGVEDSYRDT